MRQKLTFTSSEMWQIINALDFYSRIWIGQYDKLLYGIRWYRDCRQLDREEEGLIYLLMNIRHQLLPGITHLGWSGSYGIFCDEVDFKSGVAYDMQQEFRYKLSYFEHPEGGYTVNFREPLVCERDPYKFPKATCRKDGDVTVVDVDINSKQLDIIKSALLIEYAALTGQVTKMFEFYTKKKSVFKLTKTIDKIFDGIAIERDPADVSQLLKKISEQEKV